MQKNSQALTPAATISTLTVSPPATTRAGLSPSYLQQEKLKDPLTRHQTAPPLQPRRLRVGAPVSLVPIGEGRGQGVVGAAEGGAQLSQVDAPVGRVAMAVAVGPMQSLPCRLLGKKLPMQAASPTSLQPLPCAAHLPPAASGAALRSVQRQTVSVAVPPMVRLPSGTKRPLVPPGLY